MRRNPRKISLDAADALVAHRPFSAQGHDYPGGIIGRGHTSVQVGPGSSELRFEGVTIAELYQGSVLGLSIRAGRGGKELIKRLNALPGVRIYQRGHAGQLYLNGKKWDGNWTDIEGTEGIGGRPDFGPFKNPRRRKNTFQGYGAANWPRKIGKLERVFLKKTRSHGWLERTAYVHPALGSVTIEDWPEEGGYWVEMRALRGGKGVQVLGSDLRKTEKGALNLAKRYVKKYAGG